MKAEDLSGIRFGRLVALDRLSNDGVKTRWRCRCDCGSITIVISGSLKSGRTRSCGCLRIERVTRHGKRHSGSYSSWLAMMNRCKNKSNKKYHLYGGRGITVCDRWKSFKNFYEDMGDRPAGKTLDRIDDNGGYEPSNVRWATRIEQANNTRSNTLVTLGGKTQSASQWARELNIPVATISSRVKRGWPAEMILSKDKYISLRGYRKETGKCQT